MLRVVWAATAANDSTRRIVNHPLLSVQLYTVREAMQSDLPGTLARIAEIGFDQVEPYSFTDFPGIGDALKTAGLAAPTAHGHFVGVEGNQLDDVFASAKSIGGSVASDKPTEKLGKDGGPGLKLCVTGDDSPAGTESGGYKKRITYGLMGAQCFWEQINP